MSQASKRSRLQASKEDKSIIRKNNINSRIPKKNKKKKKVSFRNQTDHEPSNNLLYDLSSNYKVKLKFKDNNTQPNFVNLELIGLRHFLILKTTEQMLDNDGYWIYSYITLIASNITTLSLSNIITTVRKFIYYKETTNKLFNNTLNEMNIFLFAAKHEEK